MATPFQSTARGRPPPSHVAQLRESLLAAVAELERSATSTDTLQIVLSPLVSQGLEVLEAFQALDEISQHLHGLAGYLRAVAEDCPTDWRLDVAAAAGGLRLHSQKLRLAAAASTISADAPTLSASGELELW